MSTLNHTHPHSDSSSFVLAFQELSWLQQGLPPVLAFPELLLSPSATSSLLQPDTYEVVLWAPSLQHVNILCVLAPSDKPYESFFLKSILTPIHFHQQTLLIYWKAETPIPFIHLWKHLQPRGILYLGIPPVRTGLNVHLSHAGILRLLSYGVDVVYSHSLQVLANSSRDLQLLIKTLKTLQSLWKCLSHR